MKKFKTIALVLICLGVFLNCYTVNAQESKLDEVLKRGHIIIGVTSSAPPLGFIDEKTKELVGFEIDLGKLLAKSLFNDETKVEFVKQAFEARWPNVQSGKVDCGIMTTTIYPERLLRVAFTRRYMDSAVACMVREDSPIKHLQDLNNEKYTVVSPNNPASAERVQRYMPKAKAIAFGTFAEMLLALQSRRADAIQMDLPIFKWNIKQNPGKYRILPEMFTDLSNNAIFLRKGDFQWWLTLDTLVCEMQEGGLYPQYKAIFQKWFGEDPPPQRFYLNK